MEKYPIKKISFKFRRYISRRTLQHFYDPPNKCHPRLTQNIISEMHFRVLATNILIVEQSSEFFGNASMEV